MTWETSLIEQYIAALSVRVDDVGGRRLGTYWSAPEHKPCFSRLWYIESGYGFFTLNGALYTPEAGEMVLLPAGQTVSFGTMVNRPPYFQYWADFDARVGSRPFFDLVSLPPLARVPAPETTAAFRQLANLRDERGAAAALMRKSLLYQLISLYIRAAGEENLLLSVDPPLYDVLQYIEDNLERKISAEELAALLHYSVSYFVRYFKRYMHCTPIEYINMAKIQRAKSLLLGTDMSIRRIAVELSFSDESYFSRVFRYYTGHSPTYFRKFCSEKRDYLTCSDDIKDE